MVDMIFPLEITSAVGTVVAGPWWIAAQIKQAHTELKAYSTQCWCRNCESYRVSEEPQRQYQRGYRSTMCYRFIAASPLYRFIIWFWRTRE